MPERRSPVVGIDEPYLPSEPPHWAARGLAWLILGVFAAAFVASLIVSVPETVSSPFVLVPARGGDPVRAPRGGVVAAVRIAEGQGVKAGDATFTIRSAVVGERAAEMQSLETQLAGVDDSRANVRERRERERRGGAEESRRLALRHAHLTQKLDEHRAARAVRETRFKRDIEIQENEIDIGQREVGFKVTHHAVARELAERMERVYRQGAISWLEYNNRRLESMKLEVEIQQVERALENARLKLSQLRAEHETWEIDWKVTLGGLETERREVTAGLEQLRQAAAARDAEHRETERRISETAARARIRSGALREELADSRGGELVVPAPCAGTVLRLRVNAPGAVVQEADTLAELACSGQSLQAEVSVPPSGAGRIVPGQVVRLLYDAFPYQRYGIRYATVRWVSPAAVMEKDRPVFRALADIEDRAVRIRGEDRSLMAGMSGRADIVVGRRTLIAYAFEPIRVLRETLGDGRSR